jgi:ribosome biogenesis protein BRX1
MPKIKRAREEEKGEEEENEVVEETLVPSVPTGRYTNKQRVLILCGRGINARHRHLMDDLRMLIPHHKKDHKLESKDGLSAVNEIAELKGCNNTLYMETKNRSDLYMWVNKTPLGPSVKFQVLNIHTMSELRLTGNCMAGSRPLLNFSAEFGEHPALKLMKELLIDVFGIPNHHPKSKPFIDRVLSFVWLDGKIWVRHYQIDPFSTTASSTTTSSSSSGSLTEIGPRFVLQPIRVFRGSFGGQTLFKNRYYVTPSQARVGRRKDKVRRYQERLQAKIEREEYLQENKLETNSIDDVFKKGTKRQRV